MDWKIEDRIKQVILALERGEVSRTTAAADLRRILKATSTSQ